MLCFRSTQRNAPQGRLRASIATALCVLWLGCKDSTPSPSAAEQRKPEPMSIVSPDAGPTTTPTLRVGLRAPLDIPSEDWPVSQASELAQKGGTVAYKTATGTRLVYVAGNILVLGPKLKVLDWATAPSFEQARSELYQNGSDAQRAQILEATKADASPGALAAFLVSVAGIRDGGAWWKSYEALPESGKAKVVQGLAKEITGTEKPTLSLERAVLVVDLAAQSTSVLARLEALLLPGEEIASPLAVSVLLRAMLKEHPKEAGDLACRALTKERANATIASSLALTIAKTKTACPALLWVLEANPCAPDVRCTEAGPVGPQKPSMQTEGVCTTAQALAFVDQELLRSAHDVMSTGEPAASIFALAGAPALPETFTRAHARRLYALAATTATAPCSIDLKEGTACRCNEAILRDAACRSGEASSYRSGACAFTLLDAKKTIASVVSTRIPR
jgi:hypothetical protein